MSDPLVPTLCTVDERHRDSDDVFTLVLSPPGGRLDFEPGQFNMLYAPRAGESAISISGDPARPDRLVHTIRALGNVTRLFQALPAGERIGVRGPFGRGWPLSDARGGDLVIMAGGIGLAPLRPVVYRATRDRDAFDRVVLLYGVRQPGDILFQEELLAWKRAGLLHLEVTVDTGDGDWRGDIGTVTTLLPKARFDPARTTAMVCGPEIMMRYSAIGLIEQGVRPDSVYVSMERNMKCATAFCGHCQLGPHFVCKDGPVFPYPVVADYFGIREF